MTGWGLRLRIFLFFALLGLGGAALAGAGLWLGHQRALTQGAGAGFVLAFVILGFGLPALALAIWWLFDENLARPVLRLATALRLSAQSTAPVAVDAAAARYLGDLAPATQAATRALASSQSDGETRLRTETERLVAERQRLAELLTDIPIAIVVVTEDHRIVLYDGQAAEVLSQINPPRLDASLAHYFRSDVLEGAVGRMRASGQEQRVALPGIRGAYEFDARICPMRSGAGYILVLGDAHALYAPDAARPVIYDFSLIDRPTQPALRDVALDQLCYMVFDTETTGLLPHRDDIVQVGAVRVMNGRIVTGEVIDGLVDPGRPIPPASSKVHGITDAMVAGAPPPREAVRRLHEFAQGSVIVAHNAPFDMAFVKRYGQADGLQWDHPVLDTVLLSAVLFGTTETHTLDALCARLGITIPEALRHTALGDAQATAEALVRMLPLLTAQGMTTLADVIAQTRRHGRLIEDMNR